MPSARLQGNEGVYRSTSPSGVRWLFGTVAKEQLAHAMMQKQGCLRQPDDKTFEAAAAGADWKERLSRDCKSPGKEASSRGPLYIVYKSPEKPAQLPSPEFFNWSLPRSIRGGGARLCSNAR